MLDLDLRVERTEAARLHLAEAREPSVAKRLERGWVEHVVLALPVAVCRDDTALAKNRTVESRSLYREITP
jgi:hypothetical protein